jgi:hypothetical protein
MNTKEAIEFCRFVEDLDIYSEDNAYVVANGIPCVVELLQRGEKFEFIFSDMHYLIQHLLDGIYLYNIKLSVKSDVEYIERAFEIIEEKYFPKPKENPYEELLENILWKAIKNVIEKNSKLILKCMEKAEKDKDKEWQNQ